jgi:DNA gyrase subunit B
MGFRAGLTRTLNHYLVKGGFNKKLKFEITGEDFREGLIAILSVKVADPKFSSQTKEKLVSSEVRSAVEGIISKKLESFLLENPNDAKAIMLKAIKAGQVRETMKNAREIARKEPLNKIADLPGKLKDCQEKDPRLSELFLVEGKSAGGTAAQARNRRYQAILPLRGKILNIERVSLDRMLSSEEIGTLITALGCGIGPATYNLEKLRYHRIIIMTDADVDGSHIRTLLLTFFYRQFPELIEKGYLYIAQPPLYKLKKGKQEFYLKDDADLEAWLANSALENTTLYEEGASSPIFSVEALLKIIGHYREVKMRLKSWEKQYPNFCLQALVELPSLNPEQLKDATAMEAFCKQWQQVLEKLELDQQAEARYQISTYPLSPSESTLEETLYLPRIQEWRYSIEQEYLITPEFFYSQDYQKTAQLSLQLQHLIDKKLIIKQSDKEKTVHNFSAVYDWLMKEASRGYTIQRYKGLGEMNAEQLAPVISPDSRRISRVTIDDAIAADRLFTILMGDIVEPRREFIEQNALEVTEIDI